MEERLKRLESEHMDSAEIRKSLIKHRDAFLAYKQQEFLKAGILNTPPPVVSSGIRRFGSIYRFKRIRRIRKRKVLLFKKKARKLYGSFSNLLNKIKERKELELKNNKTATQNIQKTAPITSKNRDKALKIKLKMALKKRSLNIKQYDFLARIRTSEQQLNEIAQMKKELPKDFQQRLPSPLDPNIELLDLSNKVDMPLLPTSENNLIEAITKLHATPITPDEYSMVFPHHNFSFFNPLT
jgi:hypothetical protein